MFLRDVSFRNGMELREPKHRFPPFKYRTKFNLHRIRNISMLQECMLTASNNAVTIYSTIEVDSDPLVTQIPFESEITRVRNIDRLVSVSGSELSIFDFDELIYTMPFKFSDHLLIDHMIYGIESNVKIIDMRIGICTHVVPYRPKSISVRNHTMACTTADETRIYDVRMFGKENNHLVAHRQGGFECSLASDATYVYITSKPIKSGFNKTVQIDLMLNSVLTVPGMPITSDLHYCRTGKDIVARNDRWTEKYTLSGHLDTIRQLYLHMDTEMYTVANDGIICWERSFEVTTPDKGELW